MNFLVSTTNWNWDKAWEVFTQEFPLAIWETLYSTFLSTFLAILIGLPLGVLLVVGEKDNILPLPKWLMITLNWIVNIFRSIPFLILMIMVLPLSMIIFGTQVGTIATIIPLVVATFPFIARLIENSIREVNPNIIEASLSLGASPFQIITHVLIPEAMPSIVSNITIALTTVLGYTAMSGTIGGGGLGRIAISYGYNRYQTAILFLAVVVIVILVIMIQTCGTFIANKMDHRLKKKK